MVLSQHNGRKSIKWLQLYKQKVSFNANCKEFEDTCIKCWVIYLNKTIREHLNTLIHKPCICLIIHVIQVAITLLKRNGIYFITTQLCLRTKHLSLILAINYLKLSTLRKIKWYISDKFALHVKSFSCPEKINTIWLPAFINVARYFCALILYFIHTTA